MTKEEQPYAWLNGKMEPVEETPEGAIDFIRGYLKAIRGEEFDTKHWCALETITPHEAAILLLGGDPQYGDTSINEKMRERLEQRLTAHNAVHPKHRSWREWHQVAKDIEADYERGFDAFFASEEDAAPTEEAAQPQAAAPVQRSAAQDDAILNAIRAAGYDPIAMPVNEPGMPGPKAAIRAAVASNPMFSGTTVFDKAWDRMLQRGDIADHPKN